MSGDNRLGRLEGHFVKGRNILHLPDVLVIEFSDAPHVFPPRLEVVALEEDANGFTPDLRDQLTFDHLLGYQTDCPAGETLRRLAANHGNDALFLRFIRQFGGAGSLLLVKRTINAAQPVPVREA